MRAFSAAANQFRSSPAPRTASPRSPPPWAAKESSANPAPGKWNAREIVCHLADTELVFAFRLRQAIAEPDHIVQPFDQDKWASNYAAYDLPCRPRDIRHGARRGTSHSSAPLPPDDLLAKR